MNQILGAVVRCAGLRTTGLVGLLVVAVCVFCVAPSKAQSLNNTQVLRAAQFQFDDLKQVSEVTLPHLWDKTRPNYSGTGSYRIVVPQPLDPKVSNAIYIPRWMHNGELRLNGVLLYRGGRFVEPVSRHFNRPVYAVVPSQLIEPNRANEIELRIYGLRRFHSGVSQLYVGPQTMLLPMYDHMYLWNITGVKISIAVSIAVGLTSLVYGIAMGYLPAFVLFGIAAIVLGARNYALIVRDIPMPSDLWSAVLFTGYGVFITFATMAGLRFAQYRSQRIERILWWTSAAFFFVPVAIFNDRFGFVLGTATALITPFAMFSGIAVLILARRARSIPAIYLGAAMALYGAAFMFDASFFLDLRPFDTIFIAHYVALAAFSVVLFIIIREHLTVMRRAKSLAQGLEGEVASYGYQLSLRFARLREIEVNHERETTMQQERARMTKEINDTIGARLTAARNSIDSKDASVDSLAEPVQSVLDELRLMIDSLDPNANDLLAFLGNYRYRMERRLKRHGVSVRWDVERSEKADSAFSHALDSGVMLALARFVHECVMHVLQHHHYREIVFSTKRLEIVGNSSGADELTLRLQMHEHYAEQRPLLSTRLNERANALQAKLVVHESVTTRDVSLQLLRSDA